MKLSLFIFFYVCTVNVNNNIQSRIFVKPSDEQIEYIFLIFRWKSCVSSATDSFSAAVGKMYVSEHFQEAAKEGMLEMVGDIRAEFKKILNEVMNLDSS